MSFTLSQLFPGIATGLNEIGFLFGAGTSKEAGYPLMSDLTKSVVSSLTSGGRVTLDEILGAKGLTYDPASGTPNIEVICDFIAEYSVVTQESRFFELELEIRKLIVETILSVRAPDLTNHVRLLEALKRRGHGTSSTVTILTTNYDILLELAAAEVGIRVETGFDGSMRRVFDPAVFDLARGTLNTSRFTPRRELQLNIMKLHGSVSWRKHGANVVESGLDLRSSSPERSMVLPRRRKIMETLDEPFDQIFTKASRTLGASCKYLVSCGFSFGDKHINDQLIFPKLRSGEIRLTALCGTEPECFGDLKRFQPFNAGFPNNCFVNGEETEFGTDLWRFSNLAGLIDA